MARGRTPKPEMLAWLQGNPRRAYKTEPEALPPDGLACPEWLATDPIAKQEWSDITTILRDMKLLSRADKTALACYCDAFSRWRKAREAVQKHGPVIPSPDKKYPLINPEHTVMRQSLADLTTFLKEFGLSPVARSRMAVDIKSKPADDKWSGLFKNDVA